jgi:hypothetical protein
MAESALTPAVHLLDHRQARYAQRILSAPKGSGTEDILKRRGTAITERLRAATHLREEDDEVEVGHVVEGMRLKGRIVIPKGDDAEKVARRSAMAWKESKNTAWTDGSRLENRNVGCAVVWMEEASGEAPQRIQRGPSGARPRPKRQTWTEDPSDPFTKNRRRKGQQTNMWKHNRSILSKSKYDRWSGEGYFLGSKKEVFDAELYAIYRAVMRFGKRREHNQDYTIFTDAQAAIERCKTDSQGPGQEIARAIITWSTEIAERGNTLTLRWVPGHAEVEGNEVADEMAKEAALSGFHGDSESRSIEKRITMAYLKRQATEAKSRGTKGWIKERTDVRRAYIPRKKIGFRKELKGERKSVASRYYQLLTGHALIAPFLKNKLRKTDSDLCWWCEDGKKQTREHLFKECKRWKTESNVLWKEVGKKLGWKHRKNKKISVLFSEDKVTGAVLQFLRDTDVGKIKARMIVPPAPDWDDGGSDTSERERRRGRDFLESLL